MTRLRTLLIVLISAAGGAALPTLLHDRRAAGILDDERVTLLEYHALGRRLARDYLRNRIAPDGRTLLEVVQACTPACVRVDVVLARRGRVEIIEHASGVVVAAGRYVLTAGHAVREEGIRTIRVLLADGTEIAARVAHRKLEPWKDGGEDWAVLELGEDRPADLTSLPLGEIDDGTIVVAVGYSDQIGADECGLMVYSKPRTPLEPLPFPMYVFKDAPITLQPTAGAVPLGGLSGAPVVNERGEVVALFVEETRERDYVMRVHFGASSVVAVRELLGGD